MYGAQGRNRTTDTAIFSRMLYQLSYLGTPERPRALALEAREIAHPRAWINPSNRHPLQAVSPVPHRTP